MKRKIAFAIIFVLIASILFDIIITKLLGYKPAWLAFTKLLILAGASIIFIFVKDYKQFSKYTLVLATIVASQIITDFLSTTSLWNSFFSINTFIGTFSNQISLKVIRSVMIIGVLLFTLKSPKRFYLCKGNLSVKADKISWLGIDKGRISWGKLSLISAIAISVGTILLIVITVTGISAPKSISKLLLNLPVIVLFALTNSFCEGIIFRTAILGTLRAILPKKHIIIIAAIFFGIAHYYGAPSGVVGVFMSGLLGWYMCRSMYETNGFLSSWIIHFMQDVVIFSSIFLFGGYL